MNWDREKIYRTLPTLLAGLTLAVILGAYIWTNVILGELEAIEKSTIQASQRERNLARILVLLERGKTVDRPPLLTVRKDAGPVGPRFLRLLEEGMKRLGIEGTVREGTLMDESVTESISGLMTVIRVPIECEIRDYPDYPTLLKFLQGIDAWPVVYESMTMQRREAGATVRLSFEIHLLREDAS